MKLSPRTPAASVVSRCRSVAACAVLASIAAGQGSTEIISAPSSTIQGNGHSESPSLSADGRYVAFVSFAGNFVGEAGNFTDIFVRDRSTGQIEIASVSASGVPATANSFNGNISGDGRHVVFVTAATNLVPGYTPSSFDVYVRDRVAGTTEVISHAPGGAASNFGVYPYDAVGPTLSFDGRFVAFASFSSNLVPADTNGVTDVFVRDRSTGTLERVSIAPGGVQGDGNCWDVDLSADGRFVVFSSDATNLVANDGNGQRDVFVFDRLLQVTRLVSANPAGQSASGASDESVVSADGLWAAFTSSATDLVPGFSSGSRQVYRANLVTGAILPISASLQGGEPDDVSDWPDISADGSVVAFQTSANDVGPYDFDFFVRDVLVYDFTLGALERVSVNSSGSESYAGCVRASLSDDGRIVAYHGAAETLVLGDTNYLHDVFLHRRGVQASAIECSGNGTLAACPCFNPGIQHRGCGNSDASNGAALNAWGVARVSADSLRLGTIAVPYGAKVHYAQGLSSAASGIGVVFGDGLLCVPAPHVRLGMKIAGGGLALEPGSGTTFGNSTNERISVLGQVTAGSTRHYIAVYRDEVAFCTTSRFNATNSFRIAWQP